MSADRAALKAKLRAVLSPIMVEAGFSLEEKDRVSMKADDFVDTLIDQTLEEAMNHTHPAYGGPNNPRRHGN